LLYSVISEYESSSYFKNKFPTAEQGSFHCVFRRTNEKLSIERYNQTEKKSLSFKVRFKENLKARIQPKNNLESSLKMTSFVYLEK
jgi:hypothetical protein